MLRRIAIAFAATTLALAAPANARVNAETLLDRAQIEDLLISYYSHFGGEGGEDFARYYTADAVFDVNGIVSEGRAAIVALYDRMDDDSPASEGTFHMIISNLEIDVREGGQTATAKMLWTGVMNGEIGEPPQLAEQGREYDYLVKQDGEWLIKKRVVIADSGLPEVYMETYDPRMDYDITEGME